MLLDESQPVRFERSACLPSSVSVLRKLASRRALRCRALMVTVDFDAALEGHSALRFKPNLPVE